MLVAATEVLACWAALEPVLVVLAVLPPCVDELVKMTGDALLAAALLRSSSLTA